MKLVTFGIATPLGETLRVGALQADRVFDLAAIHAWQLFDQGVFEARALSEALIPPDMTEFLSRWPVAKEAAEQALAFGSKFPVETVSPLGARIAYGSSEYRLCIPLRPRRIKDYLVYEEHKKKSMARRGMTMPDLWYRMPTYTNRNICGLADPGDEIAWPAYSKKLDFEFELAVVIGRRGRDVKAEDAHRYIAGFTIFNDFSARDVQADEGSIGAGVGKSKDFDQGNVLGPCIVTSDEIDGADIDMILRVDGEEWARGHTRGMKFSWGEIIENAARGETIYPGDVFASGTMDNGCCLELERWFEPGAMIEMEAKGIGILKNRVVAARSPKPAANRRGQAGSRS
jgi:2-keto-4-pentenoate hydratase/2-oxohepta-3-ene-1,7-dioic acid hydratase in catechol pathway